jgi:hypothetical protein
MVAAALAVALGAAPARAALPAAAPLAGELGLGADGLALEAPAPLPSGPGLRVDGRWRSRAAPLALATGGLLLASGFAAAFAGRQLAADLRLREGLAPPGAAERAALRRVVRLERAGSTLCVAGGVVATLGAWLWLTSPGRGAEVEPVRGGFLFHFRGRF